MKTIEKAFDILEFFVRNEGDFSISEIAEVIKLNNSTSHRIVSTLVKRGYVSQKVKRGKYHLGPKLLEFSINFGKSNKIREVALPLLKELSNAVNEAITLAIMDSHEAITIEHVMASHEFKLRTFSPVGSRNPLHCTGLGKVFLANMEGKELEGFLKNKGLPRYTKYTITNFKKLQREFQVIKREGIARDSEENELGVNCIAVPVKDHEGKVVAALSIATPTVRIRGAAQELETLVKRCGLKISKAMGYAGD